LADSDGEEALAAKLKIWARKRRIGQSIKRKKSKLWQGEINQKGTLESPPEQLLFS
jgi:hypothetical protein